MADELAAMANTHTGIVLLGVDDQSKAIRGVPKDKLDIIEAWLREISNDLIEPPLDCVIRKTQSRMRMVAKKRSCVSMSHVACSCIEVREAIFAALAAQNDR